MPVGFAECCAIATGREGRRDCQGDGGLVTEKRDAVETAGTRRFIIGLLELFVTVIHARIPFVKRIWNAAD